jgi:hypothetical protein
MNKGVLCFYFLLFLFFWKNLKNKIIFYTKSLFGAFFIVVFCSIIFISLLLNGFLLSSYVALSLAQNESLSAAIYVSPALFHC